MQTLPLLLLSTFAFAHQTENSATVPVLTNLNYLQQLKIPALASDPSVNLAYAHLNPEQQNKVLALSHENGKCGGFEALPASQMSALSGSEEIAKLKRLLDKDKEESLKRKDIVAPKRPEIEWALKDLKEENIRATVEWLSSFPDRFNKSAQPNKHLAPFEARIKDAIKDYTAPWALDEIDHQRTKQKSIRLRLVGKERPSEIVVLGGHLDSINASWGGETAAPGADDNASGSASLLEALRVLAAQGQPDRTIEFFWYAGEESGLYGSAEIAQQYKSQNKDVIAVMQLDMTMFPGAGEFVVGNVSDFTTAWLRSYLVSVNDLYVKAKLIDDKCGYACSDHASWYRQGYATLMPFESDTGRMNKKIHTVDDTISATSSFRHALVFAKFALIMAMDLGNSQIRGF